VYYITVGRNLSLIMRVVACEMFRLLFQVEDVDKKFVDLDKLKSADWVMTRQSPVKPKRVVVSTDFGFHSIFDVHVLILYRVVRSLFW